MQSNVRFQVQRASNVRPSHRLSTSAVPRCNKLTQDNKNLDENLIAELPISRVIAVAAAAIVSSTALPSAALAEEIYAAGPSQYRFPAAERYSEQQQSRFDEYLQTSELRSLLDMLQGNPSSSDLDQARLKVRR